MRVYVCTSGLASEPVSCCIAVGTVILSTLRAMFNKHLLHNSVFGAANFALSFLEFLLPITNVFCFPHSIIFSQRFQGLIHPPRTHQYTGTDKKRRLASSKPAQPAPPETCFYLPKKKTQNKTTRQPTKSEEKLASSASKTNPSRLDNFASHSNPGVGWRSEGRRS